MVFRIPPGGFAGFSQMTPASRLALRESAIATNGTRRRRPRKAAKKASRRRTASRAAKGRKLKFGSPAWRRKYMKKSARRK